MRTKGRTPPQAKIKNLLQNTIVPDGPRMVLPVGCGEVFLQDGAWQAIGQQ
jgi:hypothetical protein